MNCATGEQAELELLRKSHRCGSGDSMSAADFASKHPSVGLRISRSPNDPVWPEWKVIASTAEVVGVQFGDTLEEALAHLSERLDIMREAAERKG